MQALINTVDTIKDFLPRGVYVFKDAKQAVTFAAGEIRNSKFMPDSGLSDRELLDEFQWSLEPSEYFHIEDAFMKEQEA